MRICHCVSSCLHTHARTHTNKQINKQTNKQTQTHSSFCLSGLLCILLILLYGHATASLPGYIYVYAFICFHRYNKSEIIPHFVLPGAIYENEFELKNLKKACFELC